MSQATAVRIEGDSPDLSGPRKTTSLASRRTPLTSASRQREILAATTLRDSSLTGQDLGDSNLADGKVEFADRLERQGLDLRAGAIEIFQVNLGKLCNMACRHCHVDAGPDRTDAMMSPQTVKQVLSALERSGATTLDLTGGAPELHPQFREIVEAAVGMGKHVIDRCNLTILTNRRFAALPQWLGDKGVEIVASLPHHRQMNTDAQRGAGTYTRSIKAMALLNGVGYGQGDPKRVLTLMSNPSGAFLGGSQGALEKEWRDFLSRDHGVSFDRLFVLNNMPIARFLEWLLEKGNLDEYMQKLLDAFNPGAVSGLMCKNTLSVSWDGRVYDCDFNQMLEMDAVCGDGQSYGIADFQPEAFMGRSIVTARHCYGCTAGSGSSCGGATNEA